MQTGYPWSGLISCRISMTKKENAAIAFRIPGWLGSNPSPGGLYSFSENFSGKPELKVNGIPCTYTEENGYAVVDREWKNGDEISYELPMEVRKVYARKELKQNNSRVALQRGPIVYCVEGADNGGQAWNILVPQKSVFESEPFSVLNEPVISLVANLPVAEVSADGQAINTTLKKVRAIPYYTWCNRGSNPMQVWLPESIKDIKINY